MSDAVIATDGSCAILTVGDETEAAWVSVRSWAEAWLQERRDGLYGTASGFAACACDCAVPGVVDALLAVAEAAANEE